MRLFKAHLSKVAFNRFDRPCMFNTVLSDNVLRIIRIKFVIRIIRNTRIKQLS